MNSKVWYSEVQRSSFKVQGSTFDIPSFDIPSFNVQSLDIPSFNVQRSSFDTIFQSPLGRRLSVALTRLAQALADVGFNTLARS